jgi:HlyD family secretion protein
VVTLRGWGGAPLFGRVRLVEPSARTRISALGVEEQRLNVVIDVPDAPAALGDGYRLEASIAVWQGSNVLTVPASALLRAGDHWQLFVAENGRARRRDVTIGHIGGGGAEVLKGLRAGDRVIVFPPDDIENGVRIRAASR